MILPEKTIFPTCTGRPASVMGDPRPWRAGTAAAAVRTKLFRIDDDYVVLGSTVDRKPPQLSSRSDL
jgi:hypothetical protein